MMGARIRNSVIRTPMSIRNWALIALLPLAAATAGAADGAIEVLTPAAVTTAPQATVVVTAAAMKYDKTEVRIKAGESVAWVNKDVLPHDIAFDKGSPEGKELKSPMLTGGQAWAVKFTQPGTYDYHCTPHPFMKGKVIVE